MMKARMLLILGAGALLLSACETGTPDERAKAEQAASTAEARKPTVAAGTEAAAPATPPKRREVVLVNKPVGMLECDQIAEKFKYCLETRVTGVTRTSLVHSLDATLKHWHDVQDKGGDAATLLVECQKTQDYAKNVLRPFGCEL